MAAIMVEQLHAENIFHQSFIIRGGKKDTSFLTMIKSFWLSLIDPANEDYLKDPKTHRANKAASSKTITKAKGGSLK